MKILLVEDERDLSAMLAKTLKKRGYAVDAAYDGEEALYAYDVNEYDLIILDLNLPKKDGLLVLKEIRSRDHKIKILILSARTAIEERVQGLDTGANDYLIKPFDFLELDARIRTLLRMSFEQCPSTLACGMLEIDIIKKTVACSGRAVPFTKKEYSILEYLFLHLEKVVSSEELIEHIWDSDVDLFSNSLKYHMHSIKKKIEAFCPGRTYIKNIRGQGYILKEEDAT